MHFFCRVMKKVLIYAFRITANISFFSLKLGGRKNPMVVQKVKPGLQPQSFVKRITEYTYKTSSEKSSDIFTSHMHCLS